MVLTNLNSQVTRLYLVGIDGDYIANVIQHNTHLLEIQLSPFNRIGAEGAKWLAEAIKINSSLQMINLNGNSIGAEGAKEIAEAIKINCAL